MKRSLRRTHIWIWVALAITIPGIIALALFTRQSETDLNDPVQLSEHSTDQNTGVPLKDDA